MLHDDGPLSSEGRTEELALSPTEGGVLPQMEVSVSTRQPEPLRCKESELVSAIGPRILMPPVMLWHVAMGGCNRGDVW